MEHLKVALIHMRRSPYQALAAILVLAYAFFMVSIVALHAYAGQMTLRYLEHQPQIIAFIRQGADTEAVNSLQNELASDSRINGEVNYVSHEEAFEIFKGVADNPLITELVPPDIFSPSLEFSVVDLSFAQELITELKNERIVESVAFTGSLGGEGAISSAIDRLEGTINYVRTLGVVFIAFLAPTVVLILVVIIGMRVASRKEEIDTLRLIGATQWFIRAPFVFEGMLYGLIGAFLGFLAGLFWFLYSVPAIKQYSEFFGGIPIIPSNLDGIAILLSTLLGIELLFALFIGFLGSIIALSRYLRA